MPSIDAAAQTVFADLNQRCADAEFDRDFPENGKFIRRTIKAREYWYYQGYDAATGTKSNRYVGTVADPETTRRVEAHDRQRVDYRTRIDAVRMLRSAGFPAADGLTGRVVERLAQAGFFRLRGVLVGTVAFQTFPGLVGERPTRAPRTGDIGLAQDYGISIAIGESMSSVQEELRAVDASFRPVPNLSRPDSASAFVNASGFRVEFLLSNRGSDEVTGAPVWMPALGGVSAQPLRYLDFLISDPVRSTLLHAGGISVTVPAPERYAVHKLIVANERTEREKQAKDLTQAGFLIEALARNQPVALAASWVEAWNRGPTWRRHLETGLARLDEAARIAIAGAVGAHGGMLGYEPTRVGFPASLP
ncbi:GSU2403 family nucleotidyltransferase fold protein [Methylobacterium sp. 10]|uniref:nucleotidyltransferase family protein n=1 Tax=Methylobacterium sp. 10 TaxID=1101191 RepID=UPI0004B218EB|nr:GSU2403 family nucleotidyltransferase fold protein [Methylobacterium sp. 10]